MATKPLNRRTLIKQLAVGGTTAAFALEQLAGVPMLGTWASDWLANPLNPYDAYAMMGNALRGGSAMLGVHKAMAAGEDGWTLVQIKVCNHVHTPLVFKLGQLGPTGVTVTGQVQLPTGKMTTAKAMMIAAGVNEISDKPRYKALRFNRWFADILHNGTIDGKAISTSNILKLGASEIGPLSDQVAVQAFLGLQQIDSNNHALKGCKLRATMPDLSLYAQQKGLITSPLGISCLMMGGIYDKAEGATPTNAVLGEGATESVVVTSRTVSAYVSQIRQYVGKSYADRQSIEQNVIYRMDQLVQEDPVLRRDLLNSIVQFQSGLGTLSGCADMESDRQTLTLATANSQSNGGSKEAGATSEFLAQCRYVAASLDLPGTPVRNFSLFLNISDLDGVNIDRATDGGTGAPVKAYSYIEGMRQLGMGLNLLGKKIANGKKILIVVHSEGGRDANMGDSKTSFALVMGPRGPGLLDDALYANMNAINQTQGQVVEDMAAGASAKPWDVEGLKTKAGANATATTVPTTGDVQMGIVEFLEEQTSKSVRGDLASSDGSFVKLKRGA